MHPECRYFELAPGWVATICLAPSFGAIESYEGLWGSLGRSTLQNEEAGLADEDREGRL